LLKELQHIYFKEFYFYNDLSVRECKSVSVSGGIILHNHIAYKKNRNDMTALFLLRLR
jgi:hypothetical protein